MANKVFRHTLSTRVEHWMIAISSFLLLFSGFGQLPIFKRFNLVHLPGLSWGSNYEIQLIIHYVAAAIFVYAVTLHISKNVLLKRYAAFMKHGDIAESFTIIKAMATGKEEPPHEKFLAEQRITYTIFGAIILLLALTGLIKVFKNISAINMSNDFMYYVTNIHTILTPIFLLLIIAHIIALLIKANRPLLPSMFTGYVNKAYAEKRHKLWKTEGGK